MTEFRRGIVIGFIAGWVLAFVIGCGVSVSPPQTPAPVPVPTPQPLPAPDPRPTYTRTQIAHVAASFCSQTIDLPPYGRIPLFDPFVGSMTPEQRQIVYAAKHAKGLTHLVLSAQYSYANDQGYTYPVPGRDFRSDLAALHAISEEAIQAGLIPILTFTNGGQADWHYWFDRNAAKLREAQAIFADQTHSILVAILWEVIGPGGDWTPQQVQTAALYHREVFGADAVLAIEFGQGYVHLGNGPADWAQPGLHAMDVFLIEFPQPLDRNHEGAQQIADRVIKGKAGPFYFADRPDRVPVAFEFDAYDFIRGKISEQTVAQHEGYLRSLGFQYVGQ